MPTFWQDLSYHVSLWLIHGLLYFMIPITSVLNTVDTIQQSTVWKDYFKDQGGYVTMGNNTCQGEDIHNDSIIHQRDQNK